MAALGLAGCGEARNVQVALLESLADSCFELWVSSGKVADEADFLALAFVAEHVSGPAPNGGGCFGVLENLASRHGQAKACL